MNKTRIKRISITVLLALGIIIAFAIFIQDNSDRIHDQNEEYLNEFTTQRAISVDTVLSENLSFIRSTAYLYGQNLESSSASVSLIRDYEENTAFDMLRFIDSSGDNYTSKGVQANLSDRAYFQRGMRGMSGITYVAQSRVTGEKQIGFYAPVYHDGAIIGVMVGFYGEDYIERMLDYELFGYEGEGWLCLPDGEIIGASSQIDFDNYFDYLEQTQRCTAAEIDRVRAAFEAGERIAFAYRQDGVDATGYAVNLENKDWMLIRCFPPAASEQILTKANGEGTRLILTLIIMFGLYALFMFLDFIFENRRMRAANRDANEVSTGVASLFESFVGVDLQTGAFHYLQGHMPSERWPREGKYADLVELVLANIPEGQEREAARRSLSLQLLREKLRDAEKLSIRVHANLNQLEWLTCNFIVTHRENGEPVRMVIGAQDVTSIYYHEQKEQRRLEQALDAAEKASRAKTDFLFNMSHDLRTPMNAIIGYTELTQREGITEAEMRDYFDKIDSSSKHLLDLINDILEMSRIESGKMTLEPVPTDLIRVMGEMKELFATQMAEKGIEFKTDASQIRDNWVLCDDKRLNRVILNLVSNAFKFTPRGGTVTASLIQTSTHGDMASFEMRVRDTGIGMSPEFARKLFTPFERERTSTVSGIQGTGLGLSITKNIVDLMGGSIEVKTEQGKGTEFIIRLAFQITDAPADELKRDIAEDSGIDMSRVRVLLVEDNEINREIATMILQQEGIEVETAENGQIAVDALRKAGSGHFDLVLMDVQMPVMDGYTATRTIRALDDPGLNNIPILAMTANAFQEDVQAARNAGMDGHIAKPLDVQKLLDEIRTALTKQ